MNRAFSFGGGRQSTAALVLAAQGQLDVNLFIFANVGDDAENPDTLAYIRDHSRPYAEAHGIELVEVQRRFRDGRDPSLYAHLNRDLRGVAIPMRMGDTGAPVARRCTYDWKIRVIAHYLKRERKWPEPWQVQLGISWDESHRVSDEETPVEQVISEGRMVEIDGIRYEKRWPLCELRLRVADCQRLIDGAGLPPPPKSSCWFCPFHSRAAWAALRLRQPDLFVRAVALEARQNAVRDSIGKDRLYLTDRLKPLDVAIPEGAEQLELFDDPGAGACTSGYCWT